MSKYLYVLVESYFVKNICEFTAQSSFFYCTLYFVLMITVFYSPFIDAFFQSNDTQELFDEDVVFYKDNLLSFLLGNDELINNGFYSQREYIHMQDVKFLFDVANYLFFFSIIVFLFTYKSFSLLFYSRNILLIIVFFIITVVFFFKQLFTLFHKIFFRNDYWLLPPDSSLIMMFPESFFVQIVFIILLVLLIVHGILLLFSKLHVRLTQK